MQVSSGGWNTRGTGARDLGKELGPGTRARDWGKELRKGREEGSAMSIMSIRSTGIGECYWTRKDRISYELAQLNPYAQRGSASAKRRARGVLCCSVRK